MATLKWHHAKLTHWLQIPSALKLNVAIPSLEEKKARPLSSVVL